MFRLFLTNPDLLKRIRPYVYSALRKDFRPVIEEPWDVVLADAPVRTLEAARNRIRKADVLAAKALRGANSAV